MTSTDRRLRAARTLGLDAVASELSVAFEEAGLPSILLKGPSFSRWLYDEALEERSYVDVDFLIPPGGALTGVNVLVRRGFLYAREFSEPVLEAPGASWWRDDIAVDLHLGLGGVGAEPATAFCILCEQTETQIVSGVRVRVLNEAARCFHAATHAAKHGPKASQPLEDLRRALAQASTDQWQSAASLAERLESRPVFVAGLRLVPEGLALADRSSPGMNTSARVLLSAAGAPPLAVGLEEWTRISGVRPRLRLLLRELFPSREFMRIWRPRASRGPASLALSYVLRVLFVLRHALGAVVALLHARREARRPAAHR